MELGFYKYKYEGNRLISKEELRQGGDGSWSLKVLENEREGYRDIEAEFELKEGVEESCGVGLEFKVGGWSKENYVFMPGGVYEGNRFECVPMDYPPLLRDEMFHELEPEVMVTDIQRLEKDAEKSKIELMTGDLSTPCMGYLDGDKRSAVLIFTEQKNDQGNIGMFVEENNKKGESLFKLLSPCVRERRQHWTRRVDSGDEGASLKAGDRINFKVRVYEFKCGNVQGLFDKFFEVRKCIESGDGGRCELPYSAAWGILEEKYNRDNWVEKWGYYAVGTNWRERINENWQIGWVGGLMVTLPLLTKGDEVSRKRAYRNIDFIIENGQAESGLFYGMGDGERWWSDGFTEEHPGNMLLLRKNADGLYFLLKQFGLLGHRNERVPIEWEESVRRLADAFVEIWERYGQFGQFVDIETGEIIVGGSTGAVTGSAGLALAYEYFGDEEYLKAAEESGDHYYEKDIKRGLTTGGPGEILQAPDSESVFSALESFIVLYEVTGNQKWLVRAEEAARQCSSWVVSYDYEFPEGSLFDRLGIKTTGSIWASASNKCSTPGICTLSGDSLLKLYRATGGEKYIELLRDIANGLPQYLSREDMRVGSMPAGWMSERINMTDWEGKDQIGEIFEGSCWCEVSLMLSCYELPGVYVDVEREKCWCFDNVRAEICGDSEEMSLEIFNESKFDAEVTVLAEGRKEKEMRYGNDFLSEKEGLKVGAGESRKFKVKEMEGKAFC